MEKPGEPIVFLHGVGIGLVILSLSLSLCIKSPSFRVQKGACAPLHAGLRSCWHAHWTKQRYDAECALLFFRVPISSGF